MAFSWKIDKKTSILGLDFIYLKCDNSQRSKIFIYLWSFSVYDSTTNPQDHLWYIFLSAAGVFALKILLTQIITYYKYIWCPSNHSPNFRVFFLIFMRKSKIYIILKYFLLGNYLSDQAQTLRIYWALLDWYFPKFLARSEQWVREKMTDNMWQKIVDTL